MNERIHTVVRGFFKGHYRGQFWLLQFLGWSGLSVISYFSLNVWYNQPDLAYIEHNILQSLLGVLLSWPMRYVFRALWDRALPSRLLLIALTVLVCSGMWAALRLALFEAMTTESGLWSDFGGWLFPSIFIFSCWTALYHVFKYYRQAEREHAALVEMSMARSREAARAATAEATAREAQLTMLRYQLNPHFLFNTLNAVQSLVTSGQTSRATEMIAALSDFLRYSLYLDPDKLVTVEEEINVLRRYLLIEQARFGDRLRVNLAISEDARGCLVPSMLLQPLVENAIKHAIGESEDGGTLSIEACCENGQLKLDVSDTGAGTRLPTPGPRGVGLRNVHQRLANCYGGNGSLELRPRRSGGVCAEVRVPLPTAAVA